MNAKRQSRRAGFTIVELLVAMALIVLIMAVLSEAFVSGLNTFSRLKSIGDMQERMRAASVNLRLDLLNRHFDADRKLSDPAAAWDVNQGGSLPLEGFFRIQASRPIPEGFDSDGLPSYRTDPNGLLPGMFQANGQPVSGLPVLHFGLKITPTRAGANLKSQLLTCRVPPTPFPNTLNLPPLDQEGPADLRVPGTMNSPWAEVAYFLVPTIDPATGLPERAGGNQLFSLHRRQRLCVAPGSPATLSQVLGQTWGIYPEVSCAPYPRTNTASPMRFNSERDLTTPSYRSMMDATGTYSNPAAIGFGPPADPAVGGLPFSPPEDPSLAADDLLVADVISFEIKVMTQLTAQQDPTRNPPMAPEFWDINDISLNPPQGLFTPAYPNGIYDTATTPVNQLQILAIKVVIRVWDFKSNLTRQVTVVQEM
jgi:prepilin-type N-terminal cleavage/methylation domain-containing protein